MEHTTTRQGLISLTPMFVLIALMVGLSLYFNDFYKVPVALLFVISSIVAILTLRGHSLNERINIFSRGAGHSDLMLMIWIFILAGAFASSAKAMGAVDSTVNLTLDLLPPAWLLPGIFLAACFVSISIGTSVGTIAALIPIVSGIAAKTGIELPLLAAATVGGAFFGDNLSFISDTTVVATKTQGCKMSDKFRTNFFIALPAALVTVIVYLMIGHSGTPTLVGGEVSAIKILPYISVLLLAILGLNVMIVLIIGLLMTGIVGLATSSYDLAQWMSEMWQGISGMSETIIIALLAGGMLAVIRHTGGISWIINCLSTHVKGRRGGECAIGLLVGLVNLCTANNTVAILSVGSIAKDMAQRFGISPRRSASILDTFSCFVQSIIPYGAQLLIASGLAAIPATAIIPYLYYPFLLGIAAFAAIIIKK